MDFTLNHYLAIVLGLLLGLLWNLSSARAGDIDSQAALAQSLIEQRVNNRWNVGIVGAIVDGQGTRFVAAGKRSASDPRPLDAKTVFEIGSISKAFTGVLLAEAVERKEVSLEQPLSQLLPPSVAETFTGEKAKIVLRHLSQHTSGLARLPDNLKPKDHANPYADYSLDQMWTYLKTCKLSGVPGEKYEYSNLGAGLLGHLLASKAGLDYETLLVQRVCEPLQMNSTRVVLTPAMREQLAGGHDPLCQETSNWDIPTLAGAGAIRSNIEDLIKFVQVNLKPDGVLRPALLRAHAERHRIDANLEVGLGWHVSNAAGREIIWHNGQTGGYSGFLGLDLKNNRAVVLLTNTACVLDDIGMHLLERKSPLDRARQKERKVIERKEVQLQPQQLEGLVGEYALAPTFSITITHENGKVMAQATAQEKFEVFAESETKFFYKVVDAQLTFERGADGKATQLTLHQNGQNIPGKKVK